MLWIFLFLIPFAYAEAPNYENPYSPIITDKEIYSWTDKVKITILAPSWNSDSKLIDDIGIDPGNFIKISTRGFSLEPYKLTETDVNNGIFTGEIILTGFSYDVDGDGSFDTRPRTLGQGPTNGFLETDYDSALTISFEFADGIVVTKSVPISWNLGTISFLEQSYNYKQNAIVEIIDYDMNLNPEGIDQITISVYSDSDIAGIDIEAVETNANSGIFHANVIFSVDDNSSGNRLFSKPGDSIFAKYEDRTLPKPYNISDEIDIIDKVTLFSNLSPISKIEINSVTFTDNLGNNLAEINVEQQVQIVGEITNNQEFEQPFTYLIQVKNNQGSTVQLSWIVGVLQPYDTLFASRSWTPTYSDSYSIQSFVWESIPSMNAIAKPVVESISVQ